MLTGATIRNFRGLRDVTVDGFSRVNIVVGDNGSGKTSLLEAVYLALSNSALIAAQLRTYRLGAGATMPFDLLSDVMTEGADAVRIALRGGEPFARQLVAKHDPGRTAPAGPQAGVGHADTQPRLPFAATSAGNLLTPPGLFRWESGSGRFSESVLLEGSTLQPNGTFNLPAVGSYFLSTKLAVQPGLAQLFSDLDKSGDADVFLQYMAAQFSDLQAVSVQLDAGQAHLYAKMRHQQQPRPLEYHSGGMTQLGAYLLCLSAKPTRVVMIDEIENGLHHSRFPLLWRQIKDFSVRFDKQVFATTHSQECLDAAADAMEQNPEDFALIRTSRKGADGVVGMISGEPVRSLLRSGLEVRG